MPSTYSPPPSLTIISTIFLGIGAISALIIIVDIILRRGWKSMMAIMLPVWPINAAYMGPVTLFLYFKYGRPDKPGREGKDGGKGMGGMDHGSQQEPSSRAHGHNHSHGANIADSSSPTLRPSPTSSDLEKQISGDEQGNQNHQDDQGHDVEAQGGQHDHSQRQMDHSQMDHSQMDHSQMNHSQMDHSGHAGHHMPRPNRPQWATVMVGVSHCGAGCVLGDIVGEWLVYATGITINTASIWPALLIDFAFALLLGIIFQYFSIAPMSGDYGLKTLLRAAKADVLSLVSFEVGLFGWMIAFQVGIWSHGAGLPTDEVVYWWMMQVGMFLGFWTAFPVNWWLISKGVKEACA